MCVGEGWVLPMKVECIISCVSGLESGPHYLMYTRTGQCNEVPKHQINEILKVDNSKMWPEIYTGATSKKLY